MFGAERVETMTVIEGDSVTLYTNLTEIQNDDTILWLFGHKDSVISQITRKHDLTWWIKRLDLSPSETPESDTWDNINSPSLEKRL